MNGAARLSVCVLLLSLAGCGSQARVEAERRAAMAAREEAEAARAANDAALAKIKSDNERRQRFECELIVKHRTGGGEGSSSHRTTRYDDGKPFSAVENVTTTIKGEKGVLKFGVNFKEHRDGKDVYEVSASEGDAKGERSVTTDRQYEGKPLVVYESEQATLTLQPPAPSK